MAKVTEGEWSADRHYMTAHNHPTRRHEVMMTAEGVLLGKAIGEEPSEAIANAQIMASSKELLAALKGLMDLISRNELVRNTKDDLDAQWAMKQIPFVMKLKAADDAIAKAEGK